MGILTCKLSYIPIDEAQGYQLILKNLTVVDKWEVAQLCQSLVQFTRKPFIARVKRHLKEATWDANHYKQNYVIRLGD